MGDPISISGNHMSICRITREHDGYDKVISPLKHFVQMLEIALKSAAAEERAAAKERAVAEERTVAEERAAAKERLAVKERAAAEKRAVAEERAAEKPTVSSYR
jgi:hypothetical protein